MINPYVSLVIPAFNEERTIGEVINSTAQIMDNYGFPYEILVVNDGSSDRTGISCIANR